MKHFLLQNIVKIIATFYALIPLLFLVCQLFFITFPFDVTTLKNPNNLFETILGTFFWLGYFYFWLPQIIFSLFLIILMIFQRPSFAPLIYNLIVGILTASIIFGTFSLFYQPAFNSYFNLRAMGNQFFDNLVFNFYPLIQTILPILVSILVLKFYKKVETI